MNLTVFRGFNESVTDRPTDRQTDRQTDTASYRDAWAHLNKQKKPNESMKAYFSNEFAKNFTSYTLLIEFINVLNACGSVFLAFEGRVNKRSEDDVKMKKPSLLS